MRPAERQRAPTKKNTLKRNRSVEARGDSLLSSPRMQMTTCVSCWQAHKIKQQQDQRRNHHGPLEGCGKQQGSMRKPGIPLLPPVASRTMTMSISPPSLWIIVGRPAWISARIATALFSDKVRSHSSRALCARVSVCGGAFRAAGVPSVRMKGLSGGTGDGKC